MLEAVDEARGDRRKPTCSSALSAALSWVDDLGYSRASPAWPRRRGPGPSPGGVRLAERRRPHRGSACCSSRVLRPWHFGGCDADQPVDGHILEDRGQRHDAARLPRRRRPSRRRSSLPHDDDHYDPEPQHLVPRAHVSISTFSSGLTIPLGIQPPRVEVSSWRRAAAVGARQPRMLVLRELLWSHRVPRGGLVCRPGSAGSGAQGPSRTALSELPRSRWSRRGGPASAHRRLCRGIASSAPVRARRFIATIRFPTATTTAAVRATWSVLPRARAVR